MVVVKVFPVLLLYLINSSASCSCDHKHQTIHDLVTSVSDGGVPPTNSNSSFDLGIRIKILDIYNIDELSQSFSLEMDVWITWLDPRLTQLVNKTVRDHHYFNEIWKPTIWWGNALNSQQDLAYTNLRSLAEDDYFELTPNGEVFFTKMVITAFKCKMTLKKFPFDRQICNVMLVMWNGEFANGAKFVWDNPGIEYLSGVEAFRLTKFVLTNTYTETSKMSESGLLNTTDSYAATTVYFEFQREVGYYVYQVFIPTAMVVVISWIIFWVDMSAGEKVSLEIILLLTLTTLATFVQSNLPQVPYLKFMDFWLFNCISFVFLALLQIPVVTLIAKKYDKAETSRNTDLVKVAQLVFYLLVQSKNRPDFNQIQRTTPWKRGNKQAVEKEISMEQRINFWCRIVFFCLYILSIIMLFAFVL